MVTHQSKILSVTVPATVAQCHATNSGFDQSASHQQLFVHRRCTIVLELVRLSVAVSSPYIGRFFREIQCFQKLAAGQHIERQLVERVDSRHHPAAVHLAPHSVKARQQLLAIIKLFDRDPIQPHISQALTFRAEAAK